MDNHTESFKRLSSFDALYDASYKVCQGVRWKDSTIYFEENRVETILKTEADLRANEYLQLVFSCFSIIERGKPRDIRACHINDRLVQNALCEQVLIPELTPRFIYDNCATLKHKGIDFALARMKKHLQDAHRKYGKQQDFYGLRIDIKKYFDSIHHDVLTQQVKTIIKDEDVRDLVSYIISTFSYVVTKDTEMKPDKTYYISRKNRYIKYTGHAFYPPHKYYERQDTSLGLGSQASQLLALLALNEVDHFIKEKLHIHYYGRYMDDIYLIHNDKKYLTECLAQITKYLNSLGLDINKKKTVISRIHPLAKNEPKGKFTPLKYLKWNFYITETGHIIQTPFKKKISQERRKLRKLYDLQRTGQITTKEVQASYQGWRACIAKGTTHWEIQDMDNYFTHLFKGVEIL